MGIMTYYVVLPFIRDETGELYAEEAIEAPTAAAALGRASRLTPTKAGVIAFARTGDPALGEFQPASILACFGTTPEALD